MTTIAQPGGSTYVAPPGTTALLVRLWGGGGAGGAGSSVSGSGGGGQGGYVEAFLPVSGGDSFDVAVGAGGDNSVPAPGADTSFEGAGAVVTAEGGGVGGTTASCPNFGTGGGGGGQVSVLGAQGLVATPGGSGTQGAATLPCAMPFNPTTGKGGVGPGMPGFPGAGGNGADANAVPGAPGNGANGAIVIVSYI